MCDSVPALHIQDALVHIILSTTSLLCITSWCS